MVKQVLVIDDDKNTVVYLSVMLNEHGYNPIPACDGEAGLQKIEESTPDLIVLDVMLPKKTGFVLFKQLKKDESYRDVPIIMLTGVSEVLVELESRREETLEKPYDPLREALRRKIQEMREEGLGRPEMFVDKPIDPDSFIDNVRELIGN
jgi:two-component system alkaline phosphatase synthesis response regulator PhoP